MKTTELLAKVSTVKSNVQQLLDVVTSPGGAPVVDDPTVQMIGDTLDSLNDQVTSALAHLSSTPVVSSGTVVSGGTVS